jgi:hypothetical protein
MDNVKDYWLMHVRWVNGRESSIPMLGLLCALKSIECVRGVVGMQAMIGVW